MWHLDENVLHHLAAVIVHADVTGEGLAKENVSVTHTGFDIFNSMLPANEKKNPGEFFKLESVLFLPKVLWQCQHLSKHQILCSFNGGWVVPHKLAE